MQIRPRKTVDPTLADTSALDAETAWWPVTASATFRTTPEGVDLNLVVKQCRTGYLYSAFIYPGSDCSAIARDSQPWDGTRGVLSEGALCIGPVGAAIHEARSKDAPKPWTLGGPADSNLLGRTIAIHDPDTNEPLACATIEVADGGVPWVPIDPSQRPRSEVITQLAGLCSFGPRYTTRSDDVTCPDLDALAGCAFTHCVSSCLDPCADYVACLEAASEVCSTECAPNATCAACLQPKCTYGFCQAEASCAPPPTADGPCTKLRACCERQGPLVNSCLKYVELLENLGGDPSCVGALSDRDFNSNLTYRSPCYPDAGVATE